MTKIHATFCYRNAKRRKISKKRPGEAHIFFKKTASFETAHWHFLILADDDDDDDNDDDDDDDDDERRTSLTQNSQKTFETFFPRLTLV